MIHNVEDVDPEKISCNTHLICASGVREYRCHKGNIAEVVQTAMNDFKQEGHTPYYIYGNIYGQGNVAVPMETYVSVYREMMRQEKEMNRHFDYIFLASSTNTTQSGLLAGHLQQGDNRKVVGISVTRKKERAVEVIRDNLKEYQEKTGAVYKLDVEEEILLEDEYLAGGYGCWNSEIMDVIRNLYQEEGVGLDPTYTGKAFWGMQTYLRERGIRGKNVLFLHTGGTPLFFDILPELAGAADHIEEKEGERTK